MKVVLALLCAVAGVAVNAGVVEERLSRFLSAVNVADGTNVVVVLQKWGDVFLVRQDGDSSYVPVEQGARILIPCGRNISVTQTALTTAMQFDQDGSLKASWQSNYEPQYMVVSNGVESFSMKVGEVQEYFKSAAEAFRVERGNKKK